MRGLTALAILTLTLLMLELGADASAEADEQVVTCTKAGRCANIAKRDSQRPEIPRHPGSHAARPIDAGRNQRLSDARKNFHTAHTAYVRQLTNYNRCIVTFSPSTNPGGCGNRPTAPTPPAFRTNTFSGPGNQPITAGQAAAIAVARLQLPTVAPGIGPSPNLNPWNMAAVGYPLWLWADGPTHVGPITDSVAGLSVSLDATVSSLTFRMGDGHSVNCAGAGQPWTRSVQPGAKSPSCGYSYAKPSLPDDKYTVAAVANWAVTWTSNGQSGVINVPAVDTTNLPVGELQVLVR
jgi:hypothetical protein